MRTLLLIIAFPACLSAPEPPRPSPDECSDIWGAAWGQTGGCNDSTTESITRLCAELCHTRGGEVWLCDDSTTVLAHGCAGEPCEAFLAHAEWCAAQHEAAQK